MLSKNQLNTMLDLQGKINSRIDPDWIDSGNSYLRAGMVEICEAVSSHGDFKWWKKVETDFENIKTEVIDYIHFALSATIVSFKGDIEKASKEIFAELQSKKDIVRFDENDYIISRLSDLELMDLIVGLSSSKRVSWPVLFLLTQKLEMSSEEIYKIYIGKNVLNFFRQDHGYNKGIYIKIWNLDEKSEGNNFQEKEDNVYLHEAMQKLDSHSKTFPDEIYKELNAAYPGN